MEADPRAFPAPEEETEQTVETKLPEAPVVKPLEVEKPLEPEVDWKKKALELQTQKEHWRAKYERDISKPDVTSVTSQPDEYLSDEGRMLGEKIKKLEEVVLETKRKEEERLVLEKYPQIKDKKDEFNEFLESPENLGLSYERIAKLFVIEKGLAETEPKRKGLEKPTGGATTKNQPSGMSVADLKRLRENEPRKYEKLIREGRVDLDNLIN
jgi:hypothetical protein